MPTNEHAGRQDKGIFLLVGPSEVIQLGWKETEVDSLKESAETNCFPLQKHFPAEIFAGTFQG